VARSLGANQRVFSQVAHVALAVARSTLNGSTPCGVSIGSVVVTSTTRVPSQNGHRRACPVSTVCAPHVLHSTSWPPGASAATSPRAARSMASASGCSATGGASTSTGVVLPQYSQCSIAAPGE
jgi:hypothetical protein